MKCEDEIDFKSETQICSTCAIVAMSDEDFQNLNYISLIENVASKFNNDMENKKIFDWYIPAQGIYM